MMKKQISMLSLLMAAILLGGCGNPSESASVLPAESTAAMTEAAIATEELQSDILTFTIGGMTIDCPGEAASKISESNDTLSLYLGEDLFILTTLSSPHNGIPEDIGEYLEFLCSEHIKVSDGFMEISQTTLSMPNDSMAVKGKMAPRSDVKNHSFIYYIYSAEQFYFISYVPLDEIDYEPIVDNMIENARFN